MNKSSADFLVGIIFLIMGLYCIFRPKSLEMYFERWKSPIVPPVEGIVIYGIFSIIAGIFIIFGEVRLISILRFFEL